MSLPDDFVHRLSRNFSTWQTHLVTHPQSFIGNIEVISSISFFWEDDYIEKLENNQCKCLWCNVKFQGIHATRALAHLIEAIRMHIKRCIVSDYQDYLSRYKELQQIKVNKKWLLPYHTWLVPAQDVHFFCTHSHLSAPQNCASISQPIFSLFSHLKTH